MPANSLRFGTDPLSVGSFSGTNLGAYITSRAGLTRPAGLINAPIVFGFVYAFPGEAGDAFPFGPCQLVASLTYF